MVRFRRVKTEVGCGTNTGTRAKMTLLCSIIIIHVQHRLEKKALAEHAPRENRPGCDIGLVNHRTDPLSRLRFKDCFFFVFF